MAIAVVGAGVVEPSADDHSATTDAYDTSAANFLVAAVSSYVNSSAVAVTSSPANIWIPRTTYENAGLNRIRLSYVDPADPADVDAAQTFANSQAATYPALAALGFSGVADDPFDQENGNIGASSGLTSIACGSVTPTEDDELIVAVLSISGAGDVAGLAISHGFTIAVSAPDASGYCLGIALAYKIQTTATGVNPSWSWTTAQGASAAIATFKAIGGVGGGGGGSVLPVIMRHYLSGE